MSKYRAIYILSEGKEKKLGEFSDKEAAISTLIKEGSGNYCLDSREEREDALRLRNFCMCGCGPYAMKIEEIE
jgi:hypothetical protein